MDFTFTERHATIASRFVKININKWIGKLETLQKMNQKDLFSYWEENNDTELGSVCIFCKTEETTWFDVSAVIDYNEEENDEDEDDTITLNGIMFCIHHRRHDMHGKSVIEFVGNHHFKSIKETNEWINSKVKSYIMCKCRRTLALEDGYCALCYPFAMEQKDDCSVCLENNGVWVELECKHIIHMYCFDKIENKKCPLCRKVSTKTLKL